MRPPRFDSRDLRDRLLGDVVRLLDRAALLLHGVMAATPVERLPHTNTPAPPRSSAAPRSRGTGGTAPTGSRPGCHPPWRGGTRSPPAFSWSCCLADLRPVLRGPLSGAFDRQASRILVGDRIDAESRRQIATEQVVQDLALGREAATRPPSARSGSSPGAHRPPARRHEGPSARLVLGRDALHLGERRHRLPGCLERRLGRHQIEVRASDPGGDLVTLDWRRLRGRSRDRARSP